MNGAKLETLGRPAMLAALCVAGCFLMGGAGAVLAAETGTALAGEAGVVLARETGAIPANDACMRTSAETGLVLRQGRFLELDGCPFQVAGANCYYLMVFAADPGMRAHVDEVLDEAAAMGLNTIRTWAFNDGGGWNALQTAPGVYDERVFEGLDYVLDRCDQLGLRAILPLVNNWVDYGGMDQYVAWSLTARYHDDFYTDPTCRDMYRDHAAAVINRVNRINGRRYRDDPTILAWELANEPRCPSDHTGDKLQTWTEEMSGYIKSLDPNHLVGTGSEGFYNDPGPGPWFADGSEGVDFLRNHRAADIDYAGAHLWPDHWGIGAAGALSLLARQVDDAWNLIEKPYILGEFGKLRDGAVPTAPRAHYDPATYFSPGVAPYAVRGADPVTVANRRAPSPPTSSASRGLTPLDTGARDEFFEECYGLIVSELAGGAVYWVSYHDQYPDYDGFGVYYPADASTIALIEEFARATAEFFTTGEDGSCPDPTVPLRVGRAHPNPFSAATQLEITVQPGDQTTPVHAAVYDVLGRRVRVLLDEPFATGSRDLVWTGQDARGRPAPGGVYFLTVRSGERQWTRRLVRLR